MRRSSPLLTALVATCLALNACSTGSGSSDGPEGEGAPSTADTPSPTGAVDDGDQGDDQVGDAVMVGDHRHRPACSLFTPADATELLPLTDAAEFDQEARTVSLAEEDGPDPRAVDPSLATTSCYYRVGDARRTTVRFTVKEYADQRTARSRWSSIRRFGEERLPPRLTDGDGPASFAELDAALRAILADARESVGGVRVPGFDQRILWRTGSTEFVATVDNLFLTFDRGEDFGFTSRISKADIALADKVLVRAMERASDEETPTALVPPLFEQDEDWPPFLDPCSLLDAEAAETLLGRPTALARSTSVDLGPDTNLGADSAAGRSTENSCEREAEGRRGTARLFVQYVAPQDTAEDVLDSYLGNLAFGDPTPSRRQVDRIRQSMVPGNIPGVDASYVFVVGGQSSRYYSYVLLDGYVLELTGRLPQGRYGSRSVDTASLRDAGLLVTDRLATTVADGSEG